MFIEQHAPVRLLESVVKRVQIIHGWGYDGYEDSMAAH